MTSVFTPTKQRTTREDVQAFNALQAQLADLNYMYPFSIDSVPLIQALLADLISTVTTYKGLETEQEITKEELRLAIEEINRVGVIENPRLVKENNELQLRLLTESERMENRVGELQKIASDRDERMIKMELVISQLNYALQSTREENENLRTRIDQVVASGDSIDGDSIYVSEQPQLRLVHDDPVGPAAPGAAVKTVEMVANLKAENVGLESLLTDAQKELKSLKSNYNVLESKFLAQSPLTLSGNWVGGLGKDAQRTEQIISELNSKLDFVNQKYSELKQLHSRCGIVSDSPLTDLRESRKELNLLAVRFEKVKAEKAELIQQMAALRKQPTAETLRKTEEDIVGKLKGRISELEDKLMVEEKREKPDEIRKLKKEFSELQKEYKQLSNEVKIKDKEIHLMKARGTSPTRGTGDNRRLVGEIALLEEKLRQVTEDRDELLEKLGEIEAGIAAMESEVRKIETENAELKKEKISKEESFVGISKQLNEVNTILNSLSEDMSSTEEVDRLRFRISVLERDITNRDAEIAKLKFSIEALRKDAATMRSVPPAKTPVVTSPRAPSGRNPDVADLQSLVKSLSASKEQLVDKVKQMQKELSVKQAELDDAIAKSGTRDTARIQLEAELDRLRKSLRSLDSERDDLQRVCDSQTEQLEVVKEESSRTRSELTESQKSLIQSRMECERLRQLLEAKEADVARIEKAMSETKHMIERKEAELRNMQAQIVTVNNESLEITKENHILASEIQRLKSQFSSQQSQATRGRDEVAALMESLRITENERNDILGLYKQLVNENKHIRSACDRAESEKRRLETALKAEPVAVASSTSDQDLMQLQKTIDQQYALIGEMDVEQARLIVENSKLREQLHHQASPN